MAGALPSARRSLLACVRTCLLVLDVLLRHAKSWKCHRKDPRAQSKAERSYLAPIFALPPLRQTYPLAADRVGSTGEMPKSLGPNQQLSATKPAEWTTSQGIGPTWQISIYRIIGQWINGHELRPSNNYSLHYLLQSRLVRHRVSKSTNAFKSSQSNLAVQIEFSDVECTGKIDLFSKLSSDWEELLATDHPKSSSSFRPQLQLAQAWSWKRWSWGGYVQVFSQSSAPTLGWELQSLLPFPTGSGTLADGTLAIYRSVSMQVKFRETSYPFAVLAFCESQVGKRNWNLVETIVWKHFKYQELFRWVGIWVSWPGQLPKETECGNMHQHQKHFNGFTDWIISKEALSTALNHRHKGAQFWFHLSVAKGMNLTYSRLTSAWKLIQTSNSFDPILRSWTSPNKASSSMVAMLPVGALGFLVGKQKQKAKASTTRRI